MLAANLTKTECDKERHLNVLCPLCTLMVRGYTEVENQFLKIKECNTVQILDLLNSFTLLN